MLNRFYNKEVDVVGEVNVGNRRYVIVKEAVYHRGMLISHYLMPVSEFMDRNGDDWIKGDTRENSK